MIAFIYCISPVFVGDFLMSIFLFLCCRYFFYILLALVGVGLLNGLIFLPVLLSLVGPEAEVNMYLQFFN